MSEKQTQEQQILHYLKCNRHLTPMAALELFGCFRLAARVYSLKKQGHDIHCAMQYRGGKYFAEYRLEESP